MEYPVRKAVAPVIPILILFIVIFFFRSSSEAAINPALENVDEVRQQIEEGKDISIRPDQDVPDPVYEKYLELVNFFSRAHEGDYCLLRAPDLDFDRYAVKFESTGTETSAFLVDSKGARLRREKVDGAIPCLVVRQGAETFFRNHFSSTPCAPTVCPQGFIETDFTIAGNQVLAGELYTLNPHGLMWQRDDAHLCFMPMESGDECEVKDGQLTEDCYDIINTRKLINEHKVQFCTPADSSHGCHNINRKDKCLEKAEFCYPKMSALCGPSLLEKCEECTIGLTCEDLNRVLCRDKEICEANPCGLDCEFIEEGRNRCVTKGSVS